MSSQGTTVVSLLRTLRTFHKVEVSITGEQYEHLQDSTVFQVADASSAMDAARAVEEYLTTNGWRFEDYCENEHAPVKDVTLISVNPLSDPNPKLFRDRTLICYPQPTADGTQRRISFVQCEREQSLHLAYDTACVYVSDGLKVYEFGADNDYARQLIVDGSMVYVRTELTFVLSPSPFCPTQPQSSVVDPACVGDDVPPAFDDLLKEKLPDSQREDTPVLTVACSTNRHSECQNPIENCCDCACHVGDDLPF